MRNIDELLKIACISEDEQEIDSRIRGECSGPLPGGKDITVAQTPNKTLFVTGAK